jgi:hypothetical protein
VGKDGGGGTVAEIMDRCPHREVAYCDICDKRPGVRKTFVCGIETLVCEQCSGNEEEA